MQNIIRTLPFALATIFVTAPAFAQDEKAEAKADSEEAEETDEGDKADPADGASPGAPADAAAEKTPIDETIYVVQGKPYLVAGDFELTPQFAQLLLDALH